MSTAMTIAEIKQSAESRMARSIESFKADLHKIRTGRAHPGILDQVHVDYYGSMVPISLGPAAVMPVCEEVGGGGFVQDEPEWPRLAAIVNDFLRTGTDCDAGGEAGRWPSQPASRPGSG